MNTRKNNFLIFKKQNFATMSKKLTPLETSKFIKIIKSTWKDFFQKKILLGNMTFNVIYFCIYQREMSNASNYFKPLTKLISTLNVKNLSKQNWFNKLFLNKFKFKTILFKKIYLKKYEIFLKNNFSILYNIINVSINNFLNKNFSVSAKNFTKENFINRSTSNTTKLVKAFLLIWATRNNFFATVVDNKGNTLVTRTGGNSEWTGSWQRATVYSADNAMYEACFLAKQWGVETLSVHILTTFWLSQIKNSFDGLETADILIEELVYRPIWSFGGCWKKKPRRI